MNNSLLAAFVLVSAWPLAAQQDASGPDVIYYDWVDENGQLRGGRVQVDPSDPMHVDLGGYVGRGGSVTTLADNGPGSNRIDLVLVGDGYTAGELGDYAADVDGILPTFFGDNPFAQYETLFNVHRVDVISNESGVDNDPDLGISRDTALDMNYWCGGTERLLCVNVGAALGAAGAAPDVDQVLALANSSKYGGAGYPSSDLGTLAAGNGAAIEIALHEFGHSMADLADEYTYGGSMTYTGGEPSARNLSKLEEPDMASAMAKWHLWLGSGAVGTFEGGGYSELGIYRPTDNSKMRALGQPWGKVNREQIVLNIYEIVDPIDAATPAGAYGNDVVLMVDPVDPVGHALDIQWSVDGMPVAGATGEMLDVNALRLGPGPHAVSVTVVDNTAWVRDEAARASLMSETRTWTIDDRALALPYGCGVNPAGSFSVLGGAPNLGTVVNLGIDNPLGFHPAGSVSILALSFGALGTYPCGVSLNGFGMSPGMPGELLVSTASMAIVVGPVYAGAGNPAVIGVPIPNDVSFVGVSAYAQGLLFDPAMTNGVRFGLADAVRLHMGL